MAPPIRSHYGQIIEYIPGKHDSALFTADAPAALEQKLNPRVLKTALDIPPATDNNQPPIHLYARAASCILSPPVLPAHQ